MGNFQKLVPEHSPPDIDNHLTRTGIIELEPVIKGRELSFLSYGQ